MAREISVKPINDIIKGIREQLDRRIKSAIEYHTRDIEDDVRRAIAVRLATMNLDAAGIDVQVSQWATTYLNVDLGFFSNTRKGNRLLAEQIKKVRQALDCSLGAPGKCLADGKKHLIAFKYNPEQYPGVTIQFQRKLPSPSKHSGNGLTDGKPGPKCRIVTVRSVERKLVCDR